MKPLKVPGTAALVSATKLANQKQGAVDRNTLFSLFTGLDEDTHLDAYAAKRQVNAAFTNFAKTCDDPLVKDQVASWVMENLRSPDEENMKTLLS